MNATEEDDAAWKMVTVDRSGLTKRFNIDQGEMREHPTEFPLSTMRIFIDRSSVEIFVNEGDAVFSSRVFPTEEEHFFRAEGASGVQIWKIRPAVSDEFIV